MLLKILVQRFEPQHRRLFALKTPERHYTSEQIIIIMIIIMYIYHALINALSAYMIHINLNMIFYTHVEHSPTKTIYIKYYKLERE